MKPQAALHRPFAWSGLTADWGLFQWALLFSVLVHAALLLLRFSAPERFEALFNAEPLEVVLVNTRLDETPEKAQALAQSSLAGGGDSADPALRATSPFPFNGVLREGNAAKESARSLQTLETQQAILLAQVKSQLARTYLPDAGKPRSPQESAQEEQRKRLMNLVAEIERRIQEENAKPKKRYISPATQEFIFAQYYDGVRRRIEDYGTANFPVGASGQKLYGEVMLEISIAKDGHLQSVNILRQGLTQELDDAARRVVTGAAGREGFGSFGASLQRQADILVIVSKISFKQDGGVRSDILE